MLEQRLSKQQILTLYANETYMGQRGSFSINGFGEAAEAYFGKDISVSPCRKQRHWWPSFRLRMASFLRSNIPTK